jgi:hypothetical protein
MTLSLKVGRVTIRVATSRERRDGARRLAHDPEAVIAQYERRLRLVPPEDQLAARRARNSGGSGAA